MTDKYCLENEKIVNDLIENLSKLSKLLVAMNNANQAYLNILNSTRNPNRYYELRDKQLIAISHTDKYLEHKQKVLDLMKVIIENEH